MTKKKWNRICLMLPTRGRIANGKLIDFIQSAQATSTKKNICFSFLIDEDDTETQHWFNNQNIIKSEYQVLLNKNKELNLGKFWNQLYDECKFNDLSTIVSMVGDDMTFETKGWDKKIIDKINEVNGDGIVYCDDDYIHKDKMCVNIFTTPQLVEKCGGQFMSEKFKVDYIDTVWFFFGKKANILYYLDDVIIKHNHCLKIGKDETSKKMPYIYSNDLMDIAKEEASKMFTKYKEFVFRNITSDDVFIDVVMLSNSLTNELFEMTKNTIKSLILNNEALKFNILLNEQSERNYDTFVSEVMYYGSQLQVFNIEDDKFNYSKWNNILFEQGISKYVLFLNNDCLFEKNSITRLFSEMKENNYKSAGPIDLNNQYHLQELNTKENAEGYEVGLHLNGYCFMVQRDSFVGFDEEFVFYKADDAYIERLKLKNIKHFVVGSSHVTHIGQKTLNLHKDREYYKTGQYQRFYDKYNIDNILLSICVITNQKDKNEYFEQFIRNCPLGPRTELVLVENMESNFEELIHVPTTMNNFKHFIFKYKPGEFSFAHCRNIAKSIAKGRYILSLDMDEFIPKEFHDSIYDLITNPENKDIDGYFIGNAGWMYEENLKPMAVEAIRLFKNKKEYIWQGHVHELISWSIPESKLAKTKLFIYHSGYSEGKSNIIDKLERNIKLIARELYENKNPEQLRFFSDYMLRTLTLKSQITKN